MPNVTRDQFETLLAKHQLRINTVRQTNGPFHQYEIGCGQGVLALQRFIADMQKLHRDVSLQVVDNPGHPQHADPYVLVDSCAVVGGPLKETIAVPTPRRYTPVQARNIALTTFYLCEGVLDTLSRTKAWKKIYSNRTHAEIVERLFDLAEYLDGWITDNKLTQDDVTDGDYYYEFVEEEVAGWVVKLAKAKESIPDTATLNQWLEHAIKRRKGRSSIAPSEPPAPPQREYERGHSYSSPVGRGED